MPFVHQNQQPLNFVKILIVILLNVKVLLNRFLNGFCLYICIHNVYTLLYIVKNRKYAKNYSDVPNC